MLTLNKKPVNVPDKKQFHEKETFFLLDKKLEIWHLLILFWIRIWPWIPATFQKYLLIFYLYPLRKVWKLSILAKFPQILTLLKLKIRFLQPH